MGPIGLIGHRTPEAGRREDAEVQDGWKPTGRGATGRGATGRLEAYRTGRALQDAEVQDAEVQDGWKPTGRAKPYRTLTL